MITVFFAGAAAATLAALVFGTLLRLGITGDLRAELADARRRLSPCAEDCARCKGMGFVRVSVGAGMGMRTGMRMVACDACAGSGTRASNEGGEHE